MSCVAFIVWCRRFIVLLSLGFLGFLCPPPFVFFSSIAFWIHGWRPGIRRNMSLQRPWNLLSVQNQWLGRLRHRNPVKSLHFLVHTVESAWYFYTYRPWKLNMSPKNGTTSQKDISSSNHHFSGDMLVFGRVHTSLLYEDTSLSIYFSVKTLASQMSIFRTSSLWNLRF